MSHALDRLRERFGIDATTDDLRRAVDDIRTGRSVLLSSRCRKSREQHASGSETHLVTIKGVAIRVVYMAAAFRGRGGILTVLEDEPRRKPRTKRLGTLLETRGEKRRGRPRRPRQDQELDETEDAG